MYGRAFPSGNVLFFFGDGPGLFCLPGGESPLAFFAVETLQNGRIEAPRQTLDDLIGIDRSIDDFFLFVQVHLLFRSTAWLMGVIQFAKPQVWNERGRPCFAPEPASKFFLCGIQKYAPHPPSRPERALLGGFMGRRGGFAINRIQKIERIIVMFSRCQARGRVGREIFTSRPNFIRGRNRGGHTRPDSPGSRPRCAWKSGYHTGPRS